MAGPLADVNLALVRSIMNMVCDSILVLDHDLRILFANESFYAANHVRPEDAERKDLLQACDGRFDRARLRAILESARARPGSCISQEFGEDGARKAVSVTVRSLGMPGDRKSQLIVSMHEISELADAETLHRPCERRFNHFLEGFPMGVFILDSEGRPSHENQVFRAMTGKSLEEIEEALQESTLVEILGAYQSSSGKPYPAERDPLVQALSGRGTTVNDMELRKAGRVLRLEVTGAPIHDESGNVAHAVGIYREIASSRSDGRIEARTAAAAAPGRNQTSS